MHKTLSEHVSRHIQLNPNEEQVLHSTLKSLQLKPKEYLLKEYEICNAYYFVLSGCLRFYRNTENGTEQILQFGIKGWWISDYQSFENQMPSEYNIQAIEQTEVLVLERKDYKQLFNEVPLLNNYFRIMMQKAYTASLKKIELILCQSAEERYVQFNKAFPDFVQRIPQYMLASFLGFTPQFLSMLRSKKRYATSVK